MALQKVHFGWNPDLSRIDNCEAFNVGGECDYAIHTVPVCRDHASCAATVDPYLGEVYIEDCEDCYSVCYDPADGSLIAMIPDDCCEPSVSVSVSVSPSPSVSVSLSPSPSPSVSVSPSPSPSVSVSPSPSPSVSASVSPSPSPSVSVSLSPSPSESVSTSISLSPSPSPTDYSGCCCPRLPQKGVTTLTIVMLTPGTPCDPPNDCEVTGSFTCTWDGKYYTCYNENNVLVALVECIWGALYQVLVCCERYSDVPHPHYWYCAVFQWNSVDGPPHTCGEIIEDLGEKCLYGHGCADGGTVRVIC